MKGVRNAMFIASVWKAALLGLLSLGHAAASQESLASQQQDRETLVMHARDLMRARRYDAASNVLHQILARDPNSAEALYTLAALQQLQNEPRESLRTMTRAAQHRSPKGEDLRIAALDYVLLNDYPDALSWSLRATSLTPANAEAWYDLGRVLMHEGRFSEAASAFRRSIALQPEMAKALDNLGICLQNQNRNEEALEAYAAAIEVTARTPQPSAQPYLDRGKLLTERNATAEALPLLERAAELAPANAEVFAALAAADSAEHLLPAARSAMERAVELDPKNARLHYRLGRMYRSLGEMALADRELKLSANLYGGRSAE